MVEYLWDIIHTEYLMGELTIRNRLEKAIWEGDVSTLDEIAGCICCCDEHTFEHCPARDWYGCRGKCSLTREDVLDWAAFYGMTLDEFYGSAL